MIGWLRGRVIGRLPEGELLLDVNGVGYRVSVTRRLLASVPTGTASDGANTDGANTDGANTESSGQLALHIHTHVREDAIVLYGFSTSEERRCFEALLSAHGVGPSLALSVVSSLSPADLVQAVLEEDIDTLCVVPGIGRKTAARLVLDLRSRLSLPELSDLPLPGGAAERDGPRGEVRAALSELGYGADEIRRALADVSGDGSVEVMLRQALRELAGAR
ncbi:MAG TPA: Holliday junction branch migration protein RuvA [Acidimicrobiales bacterium]|nr:Holliday junction branch migration protein RuvA [Acidimicrobiales bacterium]